MAASNGPKVAGRRLTKDLIDSEISSCRRCEGLNESGLTESAPGFGSIDSPVAFVGQSLCEQCMATQIPFTGGSGILIDQSLELADKEKSDIFITNVVHCHPPNNRVSRDYEIVNCAPFLHRELKIVEPRIIVGLGKDAARVLTFFYPRSRAVTPPFAAPRGRIPRGPVLYLVQHPSWIKRQHDDALTREFVSGLAAAVTWAFSDS